MTETKALANVKTALAATGSTGNFLARLKKNKDLPTDIPSGDPILKMLQSKEGADAGKWVRGKPEKDAEGDYIHNFVGKDERFLVDITSAKHGWQAFKGGKPVSVWRSIADELPEYDDLEDLGKDEDGNQIKYKQAYEIPFLALDYDGPEKHRFTGNSGGIIDATTILLSYVRERGSDDPRIFPVVKLAYNGSYRSNHGNKIHKPGLEIVGWVDHEMNGLPAEASAQIESSEPVVADSDEVVEPEVVEPETKPKRRVATRRARTAQS